MTVDRAETVRLLAEVYAAEGFSSRWSTLMGSIVEHGPIHDPEFVTCQDCGLEFEPAPTTSNGPSHLWRCPSCSRLERTASNRRSRVRRRS